ncbi:hypothetical protein [Mucilaginibacter lutimaris]|uniref:hypothetical protein n=1 Tax=Mucilaginibacter lutimaris TaxID=931629 RepID=UPI003671F9FC
MAGKAIFTPYKKHPIAITFCVIYFLLWCWMGYIAYHDFTHNGDAEVIGLTLYYFALIVFLPYLLITMAFAMFSTKSKKFYWDMAGFVLIFILIAALMAFLVSFIKR